MHKITKFYKDFNEKKVGEFKMAKVMLKQEFKSTYIKFWNNVQDVHLQQVTSGLIDQIRVMEDVKAKDIHIHINGWEKEINVQNHFPK